MRFKQTVNANNQDTLFQVNKKQQMQTLHFWVFIADKINFRRKIIFFELTIQLGKESLKLYTYPYSPPNFFFFFKL